jgi:hypothetical protein
MIPEHATTTRRLGWVLASVALVFFVGFIVRVLVLGI